MRKLDTKRGTGHYHRSLIEAKGGPERSSRLPSPVLLGSLQLSPLRSPVAGSCIVDGVLQLATRAFTLLTTALNPTNSEPCSRTSLPGFPGFPTPSLRSAPEPRLTLSKGFPFSSSLLRSVLRTGSLGARRIIPHLAGSSMPNTQFLGIQSDGTGRFKLLIRGFHLLHSAVPHSGLPVTSHARSTRPGGVAPRLS